MWLVVDPAARPEAHRWILLKCEYSEVQVSIGILAHWYRPGVLTDLRLIHSVSVPILSMGWHSQTLEMFPS